MNYKANGICALIVLILGILFICYDNQVISSAVLVMCGVAFFVPGLLMVLSTVVGRKAREQGAFARVLKVICGIGGVGLAMCIWCMPDVFQRYVVYLFGGLLIFGAVFQLLQMSSRERIIAYPGWMIFGPLVNLTAGIVVMSADYFHHYGLGFERNEFWLVFITAVGMMIFGAVGMGMSGMNWREMRRRHHSEAPAKGTGAAKTDSEAAEKPEAKASAEAKEVSEENKASGEYQGH